MLKHQSPFMMLYATRHEVLAKSSYTIMVFRTGVSLRRPAVGVTRMLGIAKTKEHTVVENAALAPLALHPKPKALNPKH